MSEAPEVAVWDFARGTQSDTFWSRLQDTDTTESYILIVFERQKKWIVEGVEAQGDRWGDGMEG